MDFKTGEAYRDINSLIERLEGWSLIDDRARLPEAIAYASGLGIKRNKDGMFLLSSNAKLKKGAGKGFLVLGFQGASGKRSGHIVCGSAVTHAMECLGLCNLTAGNGRFESVYNSRKRRTWFLFEDPALWVALLIHDLEVARFMAQALGLSLAIRLNVFSDIPWELVIPWLFPLFPLVTFYDYTKEEWRLDQPMPVNYRLTLSYNETIEIETAKHWISQGQNVAVVFNTTKHRGLPSHWNGIEVIDGDEHDLRFLDPAGVVVGLIAKGKATHTKKLDIDSSVFVQNV